MLLRISNTMPPKLYNFASWKALSAVLFLVVLLQHFSRQTQWSPNLDLPSFRGASHENETWEFQTKRDEYNYGLTTDQCLSAFPNLYKEIDRAVEQWKGREITPDNIKLAGGNNGNARILIYNNQVRIIATMGLYRDDFHFRIFSVINQVRRAVTATEERLPNIEFNIVVDDIVVLDREPETHAMWGFNRKDKDKLQDNVWVIPDYEWFAGRHQGSFYDMQTKARVFDAEIEDKIPKVIWRGPTWSNPAIRKSLINVTEGQEWADVEAIVWGDKEAKIMNIEEFCKYAFFVHTEGSAWSGRLTWLLNCDSVPIVHDFEWIAHYYHLIDHGVNTIRVERDFTDLGEKIQHYLGNPTKAQAIADKSVDTFRNRYLSPAATACYWRELFKGWSSVSFHPELYDENKKMRGISYEDFILTAQTTDYPWEVKCLGCE